MIFAEFLGYFYTSIVDHVAVDVLSVYVATCLCLRVVGTPSKTHLKKQC